MNPLVLCGSGSDRTRAHDASAEVMCPELGQMAAMRCEARQASEVQCGLRCPLAREGRQAAGLLRAAMSSDGPALPERVTVRCSVCGEPRQLTRWRAKVASDRCLLCARKRQGEQIAMEANKRARERSRSTHPRGAEAVHGAATAQGGGSR